MQQKIKLLNEGNQRLHEMYDKRGDQIQNLENQLRTCENQNGSNQVCERLIKGIGQNTFSSRDIWCRIGMGELGETFSW